MYRKNQDKEVIKDMDEPVQIEGRNAVTEAFEAGIAIDKIFIQTGISSKNIDGIIESAKKAGVPYVFVSKDKLNALSTTGKAQGVIARCLPMDYADIEDILEDAKNKGEDPFIILLDGIKDPHNLGAIIRTGNAAGAHGIVITKRNCAGMSPTVFKASAGAAFFTKIARVSNLTQTIKKLKQNGMWIACTDIEGENIYKAALTGPIGLVVGSEGAGVSRLVKETCDFVVSIPMHGEIGSLNASVAAGVAAFEILRRRSIGD